MRRGSNFAPNPVVDPVAVAVDVAIDVQFLDLGP